MVGVPLGPFPSGKAHEVSIKAVSTKSALFWFSFVFCLLLATPGVARPLNLISLEVGGAAEVGLGGGHREVFGAGRSLNFAASAPFHGDRGRIFLDIGWTRSEGDRFSADPTFERPVVTLDLVPVTIGLRGDAVASEISAVRLWFTASLVSMYTRHDDGAGEVSTAPTYGLMVGVRPEVRLHDRWSLWVEQRYRFTAETRYVNETIDHDSHTVALGLSFLP